MGARTDSEPFGYCLNTSTIKGQGLGIVEEAELAAKAGYEGIEPWVAELDAYTERGGSLEDLGKRFADLGLSVENLIGFFDWLVDDDAVRAKALEEARRNLDQAQKIGCRRLAAPPMGITDKPGLDLAWAAEKYAELLEVGENYGVIPMVEFWGVSKSLFRLGEAVYIAIESGRRDACVLADVFHMYKGAGTHAGLKLIGPNTLALFHMNDYPAEPPRAEITDAARVYPGDGIAPLDQIFQDLDAAGFRGMLSIELFNEDYWAQDALAVLQTGLEKMQTAVKAALG